MTFTAIIFNGIVLFWIWLKLWLAIIPFIVCTVWILLSCNLWSYISYILSIFYFFSWKVQILQDFIITRDNWSEHPEGMFLFSAGFQKIHLCFYFPSGTSEFFPTGCFNKLKWPYIMYCHITLYFGWKPRRQLSSLLQDSCTHLCIVSPRWRNLHIQACSYETSGMCSALSVATEPKNVSRGGTITPNAAYVTQTPLLIESHTWSSELRAEC